MRNEHDAEDVVQEASLRALRYFRTFQGGNGRAWFLRIVRNTCSGVRGHSVQAATDPFDEEHHSTDRAGSDPEMLLLHTDDAALIERAMSTLPGRSRELLVLPRVGGSVLSRARRRIGHAHRDGDVPFIACPAGVPCGAGERADPAGQHRGRSLEDRSSTTCGCERRASDGKDGSKRWKRLRFPQGSRGDPTRDGRWTKWRRGRC